MNVMIHWCERNMFCDTYYILKDKIDIIINALGTSGYYGSICRAICVGIYTYTIPWKGIRAKVNQIQGPLHKNDIKFYYEKY